MSWTDSLKSKATPAVQSAKSKAVSSATSYAQQKINGLKNTLNQKLSDKLGSFGDKIKSALGSETLANAKLTDTTFFTSPTDDLLTPDVYGLKDNNILTSVTSKLGADVGNALEAFVGNSASGLSSSLTSALSLKDGKISLNTDNLSNRVMDAMGGKSGILNKLADTAKSSVMGSLNSLASSAVSEVKDRVNVVVNGFATSLKTESIQTARGLCDMVNGIANDNKLMQFFDVESEATLLSGVMRNAIDLNVPSVIETLQQKALSSEAASYALRSNVAVALQYGDANTISMMVDKLGSEQILADNPDAAKTLLSFYTVPTGQSTASYSTLSSGLGGLLDKLDKNWKTTDRNGEQISNLSVTSVMTDDARRILSTQDGMGVACLISNTYDDEVDMLDSFKSNFDYALIPTA